jgi:aminoglycoside 2''-phosphotransferase
MSDPLGGSIASKKPVFAMLPPFYDGPPHEDVGWYLNRIEDECKIKIADYEYPVWAFDYDVIIANKDLVFRFPRTEATRKKLEHEIAFLKFLAPRVKAHLPQYTFFSTQGDFAGYKIIRGEIFEPGVFAQLPEPDQVLVVDQLVAFINTLHSIDLRDFETFRPRRREDFIDTEMRIKDALEQKLFSLLSDEEVQNIRAFYTKAEKALTHIPNLVATHGDLCAYNVVWDSNAKQLGIIDFTDILIGDPAKDFEAFFEFGDAFVQRAYASYRGPKDDNFLQRAENYYRIHAVYTLLSTQLGARLSFQDAYNFYFKDSFYR